jgi:membrane-bound serine protease (ClpP class)
MMVRSAFLLLALLGGAQSDSASPDAGRPSVGLIRVEDAITPITTNYVTRGIATAREGEFIGLLIELDTPGGLLESTHNIVQALFTSQVPIIVYGSPDGARAASAGTFIAMAAHIAAMAPSTTIGAASPVTMSPGALGDTVIQRKIFNQAASFIESIAERRGRNKEWAVSAVREGASVTEREALELGVIDVVAASREDLLRQIDGWAVLGDTLRTAGAAVKEIPKNLAERFLALIVRPELMLILMLVAIYGIVGELTNPGTIVPGVAGVIALVLLLYASATMPINIAGYLLLGLAIILFIAEAFTPTFGLLLGAGAVAFFLGALMLFQDLPESIELPWPWLVPATILTAAFFVWVAAAGLKAQFTAPRTGLDTLIGQPAEVVERVNPAGGRVFVSGEYWNAVSNEEIREGERCEIEDVDGLTMKVRPIERRDV